MPQYINRALILVNSILRRTNNQKKIIATQLNIKRSYSVSKNTKIINNTDIIDTPSSASVLTTKIETDSVVIDKWSKDNLIDDLSKEIIFPKALDNCDEDVSHIAPYLAPTFNIAAYANKSPMIQELVKLGVELWKLDSNQEAVKCLLVRDFEDLKPYIQFLTDVGIEAERIGSIITRNPLFFNEDLDNLHTRIRYLRAHKFSRDNIARIVDKNPEWLSKNTTVVDRRLGFFQAQFKLSGEQVRFLVTKQPKLITLPSMKIRENIFAVEGQMGFHEDEVKKVILNKPNILILGILIYFKILLIPVSVIAIFVI